MTSTTSRRISTTFAYHPADDTADLIMPTSAVGNYVLQGARGPAARGSNIINLRSSILADGVLSPVRINTDGVSGVLTDGHNRYRLAKELGIEEMPVQVVPDNLRRMSAKYGRPALEPILREWIVDNLWAHEGHDVSQHKIGARTGGISSNTYLKCVCSCGAAWKAEQ